MKKLLSVFLFLFLLSCLRVNAVSPTYSNPTAGTVDFYPLMQYQMEKEETLDFANDAENYKRKRARKDAQNEYRANNMNFNPNYSVQNNFLHIKNTNSKNMTFTTDSNGNIIIKDSSNQ